MDGRRLIALVVLALSAAATQAGDLRAHVLASPCLTCHQADPAQRSAIPSLSGRTAVAIAAQLREFRAGTRPSTIMGRLTAGYSDEEIELISAWLVGTHE